MPAYYCVQIVKEVPAHGARYPERHFLLPTGRTIRVPAKDAGLTGTKLTLPAWVAQREGLRKDAGLVTRVAPMYKLPYDGRAEDTDLSHCFMFYDRKPLWLPKAYVTVHELERFVLLPGWLAIKRGIYNRCAKVEPEAIPQPMVMPE